MNKTALLFSKKLKGQSIVEVVLSIGIAALIIGALVILGSVSLRTALSSARRTEATQLATAGLEAMRFYRDTAGFALLQPNCYQISNVGAVTSSGACPSENTGWQNITLSNSSSKTIFSRKIKVEAYGSSPSEQAVMRKVTVKVRWSEGTGGVVGGANNQRDVEMSVVLSKWQ